MNRIKLKKIKYCLHLMIIAVMVLSCKNSTKEINDFLADQNLPIGVAENVNLVKKDSGKIVTRLSGKLLWDYKNKELNPYQEFPKGIKIVNIDRITRDSTTITGDYAIRFEETLFSEIIGNVVVINHANGGVLKTNQLYSDDKEKVYFTESAFTMYTENDTIHGVGFEAEKNFNNWILNETNGDLILEENEEKQEENE
ncbi:LPS export ABC transporter periplasmic protein LptC [Wenyingzhuangia sp. IMCC45574]